MYKTQWIYMASVESSRVVKRWVGPVHTFGKWLGISWLWSPFMFFQL